MDTIISFFEGHVAYLVIGLGILLLVGAIRKWDWVTTIETGDWVRHGYLLSIWGKEGYRYWMGFLGVLLIIGGVLWVLFPYFMG